MRRRCLNTCTALRSEDTAAHPKEASWTFFGVLCRDEGCDGGVPERCACRGAVRGSTGEGRREDEVRDPWLCADADRLRSWAFAAQALQCDVSLRSAMYEGGVRDRARRCAGGGRRAVVRFGYVLTGRTRCDEASDAVVMSLNELYRVLDGRRAAEACGI